ncbi:M20/M25/M40 family metallo-hydrolase [bacterium]|nr:MAG: M20/M25/M40 family metallo-hydrolase [bacterium]
MIDFLMDIMRFDSTSGLENDLARHIASKHKPEGSECFIQETDEKRLNVFFKFGQPEIIFCSHLDTVPPYIPPSRDSNIIYGRGSCDAKGQLAYLLEAARQLNSEGHSNFGVLMVSGEEDGSQGAIRANREMKGLDYVIIGEPTGNKLVTASKGNLLVKINFYGKSCHSGYPEKGDSAFKRMIEFFDRLRELKFPRDRVLDKTTYNVGKLESPNAQNVISDFVTCKIFFRTTFVTDKSIKNKLNSIADDKTELEFVYGDEPMKFYTIEGFNTTVVSFGTDAPSFTNVKNKILYGPGDIIDAHTSGECVRISDLYKAVEDVKLIYKKVINEN